jgi:hypothetical protein
MNFGNKKQSRLAALWVALAAAGVLGAASAASAQCLEPRGDLSGDGITNIVDIQCAVFVSLDPEANLLNPPDCLGYPFQAADTNCDGSVDVTDLIILIQHAVDLDLDLGIDADGDQCADVCQVPGTLSSGHGMAAGVSEGPTLRLRALGSGFETAGGSTSASFVLRPQAVGVEPATGE